MPQQVDNQNDKRLLRYILALSANFIIFIFVAVRHKIFPVRLTCAPQLLRPGRGQLRRAEYCDDHACVCVRLSVCPEAYLRNYKSKLHQIVSCCLWPWLCSSLAALQYVTHFRLTDGVMFTRNRRRDKAVH